MKKIVNPRLRVDESFSEFLKEFSGRLGKVYKREVSFPEATKLLVEVFQNSMVLDREKFIAVAVILKKTNGVIFPLNFRRRNKKLEEMEMFHV